MTLVRNVQLLTREISFREFSSVNYYMYNSVSHFIMLTSTPKKAVSSEASLIQCFICAESLETIRE